MTTDSGEPGPLRTVLEAWESGDVQAFIRAGETVLFFPTLKGMSNSGRVCCVCREAKDFLIFDWMERSFVDLCHDCIRIWGRNKP